MIPVRCYTCNSLVANVFIPYDKMIRSGQTCQEALEALNVQRMCCRRMFLGYVDITSDLIRYPNVDIPLDNGGTVLNRHIKMTRVVQCD
jgi:DNA-directed RNA polymerase I, II, and III subunit RPABC5